MMQPKTVSTNTLTLLLAALSLFGPLSIDLNLPAFTEMQVSLHTNMLQVQQTLALYLIAFAVMILFHGAISDTFGRRNVILGWLAIYVLASLGCAVSQNIETVWIFRILQGVSAGSGVINGRAIIRDMYADKEATRLLATVTMIFAFGPAIAPIIGGWIVTLLNWRAVFLFMCLYSLTLLWCCYRWLPESLPVDARLAFKPKVLFESYTQVFTTPLFYFAAGTIACNFAGLFLYLAAAPVFLPEQLGLGPREFAWLFVPEVAGMFLGSLVARRLAKSTHSPRAFAGFGNVGAFFSTTITKRLKLQKLTISTQVYIGFCVSIGACLTNVIYCAFFPIELPWAVMPLFFYCFGIALVAPVVTVLVLDLFPQIRGIAASCQVFTLTLANALAAGIVAPLLFHSALMLALGQMSIALTALALWLGYHCLERKRERQVGVKPTVEPS